MTDKLTVPPEKYLNIAMKYSSLVTYDKVVLPYSSMMMNIWKILLCPPINLKEG